MEIEIDVLTNAADALAQAQEAVSTILREAGSYREASERVERAVESLDLVNERHQEFIDRVTPHFRQVGEHLIEAVDAIRSVSGIAILDEVRTLRTDVDTLTQETKALSSLVSETKQVTDAIRTHVDSLAAVLDSLSQRQDLEMQNVNSIAETVVSLSKQTETLSNGINSLNGAVANLPTTEALNQSVESLKNTYLDPLGKKINIALYSVWIGTTLVIIFCLVIIFRG